MLVVAFTESPEQIENFLGGCITGNRDPNDLTGQNCTTLTLTKAGFQIGFLRAHNENPSFYVCENLAPILKTFTD